MYVSNTTILVYSTFHLNMQQILIFCTKIPSFRNENSPNLSAFYNQVYSLSLILVLYLRNPIDSSMRFRTLLLSWSTNKFMNTTRRSSRYHFHRHILKSHIHICEENVLNTLWMCNKNILIEDWMFYSDILLHQIRYCMDEYMLLFYHRPTCVYHRHTCLDKKYHCIERR